jgi:hypothetical protein
VVPAVIGAQQPVRLKGQLEPYLTSLSRDFPVVGLAVRARRPSDSTARTAYTRELYLAGGATLKGGIRAQAHLRVPALGPNYRLAATLSLARGARFLFVGVGNDAEFDRSLEKGPRRDYYSVRRHRAAARIEATRWIGAGLGVSLGLAAEAASFAAFPGESVFRADVGDTLRETDATAGLTLVYDRRNSEAIPTRGVLLQAGAQLGSAGGPYRRFFGVAQGYLTLGRGTVISIRGAATGLDGDPPLSARFELPAWERPLAIFGGDDSHRGLPGHRFVGTAAWIANGEMHQDLGIVRGHTVSIIGFVDGGRVFEGEPFRLDIAGIKLSAGVGLGLRGRRERLGAALAALGPDGIHLSVMSGWSF